MEKNQVYIIHMDISSQGVGSRKLYIEKVGKVSLDRHIQTHQHLDRVPDGEILSRGNSNSYSMSFELIAILVPYGRKYPLCIFMHQMEFMTISFSWKPLVPSFMELIQCLYLTQKHGWFYIWVIIYRYPHVLSDKSHRDSAKAGGIALDV